MNVLFSKSCFIFAIEFNKLLLDKITMSMLEKEFEYYLKNQADLVREHNGKYVVIKGEEVLAAYDSDEQAYFETIKSHEPGTFLIQFCEPGESAYTQSFHSRVLFGR
jgi:hypothetical protein